MKESKKEELKKEFGEFLQKNNAGKYFKDGNMIDAYGNCNFIEDYWLSVIDQLIQEKVEKIEKCSDFADSGDTLKSRIITILKE